MTKCEQKSHAARIHETAGRYALAALLYDTASRLADNASDRTVLRAAAIECAGRKGFDGTSLDFLHGANI